MEESQPPRKAYRLAFIELKSRQQLFAVLGTRPSRCTTAQREGQTTWSCKSKEKECVQKDKVLRCVFRVATEMQLFMREKPDYEQHTIWADICQPMETKKEMICLGKVTTNVAGAGEYVFHWYPSRIRSTLLDRGENVDEISLQNTTDQAVKAKQAQTVDDDDPTKAQFKKYILE